MTNKIHCWYVITTDEADNAYLGCEGPFWAEEDLNRYIEEAESRLGVDEVNVIAVPVRDGHFSTHERKVQMNVPRPLNDHVVIRPLGGAKVTKGGIHIPETAQKRANRGEVLAVGPGAPLTPNEAHTTAPHMKKEDPARMPMTLKEGDIVYFSSFGGSEIELADGGQILFFREVEVLGIESRKEERE